jgi:hypothetical protein
MEDKTFSRMDSKEVRVDEMKAQSITRGTKEGKLYINASDLFALEHVQELIRRVSRSKVLNDVNKVRLPQG